ncbi:protection of telomeres protein 1 isoform X2 [Sardina pilchardus]|uniref:protection of telomeres protein 1 isoform X2 n=1 Tax=Sardina pilchardus TaxID=27697 RepID=UPI002E0D8FF1
MPVYTDQDPLNMDKWLPKTLQSIPLHTLTAKSECAGKYVKGKVVCKGPLLNMGDHVKYLLKSVIQDVPKQSQASNNISINVVLFGGLAKDFSHAVNQGDVVVLWGFTVSPSPTFGKDKLHPCNLNLNGAEAHVHVCAATAPAAGTSGASATVLKPAAKYKYVPLNALKHGSQVNVYGVVTFFKLPFPTKGTDYCSTLKLTDPSGATVCCTIFCENQENHPKIFKAGDVIRLHRVKVQTFGGAMTLVTCWGWSALTFDGAVSSPVVPRTNNKSFHFSEEDQRMVTELREWAAHGLTALRDPTVPLSAVLPKQYFDLTCQLLAKARLDSACTLLKVWDGTRNSCPFLTIPVEPEALEGDCPAGRDGQNLIADVLVYDNHVEVAQALKPGMFLCIYNLHAVPQAVPGEDCSVREVLSFHLHGGASYGRGLCALPSSSPDVAKLQRALQSCAEQMEGDMNSSLDDLSWFTASQFIDGVTWECQTVRKCTHTLQKVSLAHVKSSSPPGVFHVEAQVKSYQPKRLYQCLKLFCSQCKTIEEIPDPATLRARFGQAVRDTRPCRAAWADSVTTDTQDHSRQITLHVSSKSPAHSDSKLIFVQGASFDEICHLSSDEEFLIPVKSSRGKLTFLDSMVPFLFRGKRQFYGCRQCSVRRLVKCVEGIEVWNERSISEGLGLQLMEYVLVMKFELDDGTATLEALLLEDSDSFFHVSAEELTHSQEAQEKIQKIMDSLHPPDNSTLQRPWLELCLSLYAVDENGQREVHCQIVNTQTRGSAVEQ